MTLYGRWSHGSLDGKQVAGATLLQVDALGTLPFLNKAERRGG
jgi:hypothetical protein